MDTATQKNRLRQSIIDRAATFNERNREVDSRSLCRRILQHLPADARTIAAYHPMRSEPDILPLLGEFLQRGLNLYLPRAEGKAFVYRQATTLETLRAGPMRALEPAQDAPLLDEAALDVVLVPGMAFDYACNRLGRGNGGFDIWLAKLRAANPSAKVWGVALDYQIVNEVPLQPHDQPMDAVITPRGIIIRGQKPSW